ncbi:21461_t:CDS:2, partial [Gigaspora margarita]
MYYMFNGNDNLVKKLMASQNLETASNANTFNINKSNANTFSTSKNEHQEFSEQSELSQLSNNTKHKHVSSKKQGDIWSYINKGAALGMDITKLVINGVLLHRIELKYDQFEITTHFQKIESIPEARVESLNQAILKAWIMCNFSFETIENSFIIDLFQLAIPGYQLLLRDKLSALDGWTSPTHDSIYNFIITTPKCKEYLIKLKEYNTINHTGSFIASKIKKFIKNIGVEKFAAIVTDSAHAVNLLASNFAKLDSIKDIVIKCSLILNFFHNSHIAHRYYSEQLHIMKIKGGEIKSYCKTHWGTLFTTVDSIVKSKPVFDWILENHVSVISNAAVYDLLLDEDFYIKCHGLKKIALDKIYETAASLWSNLHYSKELCKQLLLEMRSWKRKVDPYNIFYNSTHEMPIKYIDENVDLENSHSNLNIANLVNLTLPEFLATGDAIFSLELVVTHQLRDT